MLLKKVNAFRYVHLGKVCVRVPATFTTSQVTYEDAKATCALTNDNVYLPTDQTQNSIFRSGMQWVSFT